MTYSTAILNDIDTDAKKKSDTHFRTGPVLWVLQLHQVSSKSDKKNDSFLTYIPYSLIFSYSFLNNLFENEMVFFFVSD